jgi:Peptidase family M23
VRLALAAIVAAVTAASASATGGVPSPIIFPVVGPYNYTNDYGDPRPQGRHEGNDILAPKKSPVIATEAGRIKFHTTSSRAGCMLYLYGASGTTYLYIHLNNDVTMANDNRGKCVAAAGAAYWPGLKDGAKVVAGQAIGYLGDSGDADGTPHLHFEIHPNDGGPTNPYPHLNRATRVLFAAPPGSAVTLSLKGLVLAASGTQLTMKVSTATLFPQGTVFLGLKKPITLTVPANALVDVGGTAAGKAAGRIGAITGRTAIVLTQAAKTTIETQTAQAGAFSVARIVLQK